jgi:hypothetical protein
MKKHNKITIGYVIQAFQEVDSKYVCVGQDFIAGGQVDYEDLDGCAVDIDVTKEQYQPFDMVQPEYDYYILKMIGCVEPVFVGPLSNEKAEERIEEYREDPAESQNAHTLIRITKGAEID